MRKFLSVILLVAIVLIQPTCFASNDSVTIGDKTVTLGEDKQSVISKLWQEYDLSPSKLSPESFFITPKKSQNMLSPLSITFKNSKVATIAKDWGKYNTTQSMDMLFYLMENMVKDNNTTSTVDVIRGTDPKNPYSSLTFTFSGANAIRIIKVSVASDGYTTISEIRTTSN